MGADYYKILQINKNAKDDVVKMAYRKLSKEAEAKFNQISEAYEVLSDPIKRALYDQYGAERLKSGQVPSPVAGGASFFTRDGHSRTFQSRPLLANNVFLQFFEFNPFGGAADARSSVVVEWSG